MRVFVLAIILFMVAILQSTVFHYIEILGVKPDIYLLLILSYARLRGRTEGAVFGFCAGALQDLLFSPVLGINALVGFIAGYICAAPFKDFYKTNYTLQVLLICAGLFLYNLAYYVAYSFTNFAYLASTYSSSIGGSGFLSCLNYVILPETIYTAIFAFPIYIFMFFVNTMLEKRERPLRKVF